MVSLKVVQQSNASVTAATSPRVAVFVGGTSGLGKLALDGLVRLGHPLTAYVVGRPATEPAMRPFLDGLRSANPHADLRWVTAEASLLAEVVRVCDEVKSRETAVDLLFLSAGYAPFGGRNNTSEGLEVTHSLEYYGRILLTLQLLPLLRASEHGSRVVSVGGGGLLLPRLFDADDLHLERSRLGLLLSQVQMVTMNTLGLDRLAADPANAAVAFVHKLPGQVNTGNMARYWTARDDKTTWWSRLPPFSNLMLPLYWFVGMSFDEAEARHLFVCTTGAFGGKGPLVEGVQAGENTAGSKTGGLYLVDDKDEVKYSKSKLATLRETAQDKVWAKTMEILQPYL